MPAFGTRILGRTGLQVGPLGLSSSYGMPTPAVEAAFDRGMNYLYWGSIRRDGFGQALRNLKPRRQQMVLVIQEFVPIARYVPISLDKALRRIGYDYADVLLLGYWNQPIPQRMLDACHRLKEQGRIRFVAASSHNRQLLGQMAAQQQIDILHFRYNAAHRGAETEIFPALPPANPPGMVSYTATSWSQLMSPKRTPPGEPTPTAGDCYRFVLSNPSVNLAIAGTADLPQTQHALAAVEKGPMTPHELAWMRRVGDHIKKHAVLGR